MTPWQEYKQRLGTTRPWDMLNPNAERASEEVVEERMSMCLKCPELIGVTKQCKKCGCMMTAKTKLLQATCPIGKW